MPVQITIKNVPENVRDAIKALARSRGKSMQEYLLGELERVASAPPAERALTTDQWLDMVREHKKAIGVDVPTSAILWARDIDRK
jgi:dihydropteroate synthase